jgi:hypothetical protein
MPTAAVYLPEQNRTVKLGRIRPKAPPPALRLALYLTPGATPPPPSVDYSAKAAASLRRMYLNDTVGDCVIAGKMHQLGVWSGNDAAPGGVVQATDQEVLSQYHTICGPGDNGCVITDVLDWFKARGLQAGGTKYTIDGYVAVDWTNKLEVQVALYLFGSLTIGINLPGTWTQGGDGSTWDATNSAIVGGHDVCCVGYNDRGVQIATWGGLRTITWAAFTSRRWIEECYAQLAPLWYGSDKLSPCGVDAAALAADLAKLGGGIIPPVPDPAPPIPPVPPAPTPPPTPVPTPPIPPPVSVWLAAFLEWLKSLFGRQRSDLPPCDAELVAAHGELLGLTAGATVFGIDWPTVVAWIEAELKQFGPVIIPQLNAWIDALPVGPFVKLALHALVTLLARQSVPA